MQSCKPYDTPIVKRNKFSLDQSAKSDLEIKKMQKISYFQVVKNIGFVIRMLDNYLSNLGMDHWKVPKGY